MATPTFAPTLPLVSSPSALAAPATAIPAGARAVEVAALFGDSVIDVKHCADPRGGKVTPRTWGFIAGGAAALLLSTAAFASAVSTASANDAGLKAHVKAGKPEYSYRPAVTGSGTSVVAFGGLALALAGISYGVARARREKTDPTYRIGTTASEPAFPLVAPKGDDFVFNFGAGIEGEMTVDGTPTSLAALAAAGRATPSLAVAGALELPIPSNATIRARIGQTTFIVSPTTKSLPAPSSLPGVFDSTFTKYAAGSLAAHLGLWAILQMVPMEDSGLTLDMSSLEGTRITAMNTAREDALIPPPDDTGETDNASSSSSAASMALPAGLVGKPTDEGRRELRMKNNHLNQIQASREEAIEAARGAGVMGSYRAIEDAVGAVRGSFDIENGFDSDSRYGGIYGADAGQYGQFGQGPRYGTGTGGCYYGNCQGILGSGPARTIGDGAKAGDHYGTTGGAASLRDRTKSVPKPHLGEASCVGSCGLDKKIIRRYIMRAAAKIQYCYERELLADNTLSGTVSVQFVIAADGSVQASSGSGMNDNVATCVAGVVKNISFPRPDGLVQVNYPFTFRAAAR